MIGVLGQLSAGDKQRRGRRKRRQRSMRQPVGVMDLFIILIEEMVSQSFTKVKTYCIAYVKHL